MWGCVVLPSGPWRAVASMSRAAPLALCRAPRNPAVESKRPVMTIARRGPALPAPLREPRPRAGGHTRAPSAPRSPPALRRLRLPPVARSTVAPYAEMAYLFILLISPCRLSPSALAACCWLLRVPARLPESSAFQLPHRRFQGFLMGGLAPPARSAALESLPQILFRDDILARNGRQAHHFIAQLARIPGQEPPPAGASPLAKTPAPGRFRGNIPQKVVGQQSDLLATSRSGGMWMCTTLMR